MTLPFSFNENELSYSDDELPQMKPLKAMFKEESSNVIKGPKNHNQVEDYNVDQTNDKKKMNDGA